MVMAVTVAVFLAMVLATLFSSVLIMHGRVRMIMIMIRVVIVWLGHVRSRNYW